MNESLIKELIKEERKQTNFNPTDYSKPSNWSINEYDSPEKENTQVDVIYFNGTAVAKSMQENGVAYIDENMIAGFNMLNKTSPAMFDDGTRLFVPLYRQIGSEVAIANCTGHNHLINLMKNTEVVADVCASLDYYFKNYNEGRPFLLAGASQGGAAVQIALERFFGQKNNRKHLKRLIAAYSIAYGVDKNWLDSLDYINFAEGATDAGVLISWVTEGQGSNEKDCLVADNPSDNLVINPINWKTDSTYASASECLGTLKDGQIVTPGIYNLQISPQRGCLICDNNTDYVTQTLPDGSTAWGGKSLHLYEITEAFGSVRQNMHDRIDTYYKNAE